MKQAFRNLLLGSHRIPSRLEYKFAMLRGEFAFLIFFIALFYISLDLFNGVHTFLLWYIALIVTGAGVIMLNRRGNYLAATFFILLPIDSIIFIFADVDHTQGGVYFYFVVISIASLILFSNYDRRIQLFFGFLPVILGIVARLWDFELIEPPSREPTISLINYLANFSLGLLTSMFIVQFLISRNKESELSLIASEEAIRKAADDLRQSEERYSLALKGTRAGIYEWDVSKDRVELSDPWKKLLGYNSDDLKDFSLQSFLAIVHPDDKERTSKSVQQHMHDRTPYQNEVRMRTKSGEYHWFQDTGIGKTDEHGNLQVVIGSIIDIHERKVAEEKILQQNELLAKANKELDYFVYSVSHDLRAPLSSILGLANIYSMTGDEQERADIIRMVSDRALVLDNFIREVLDYSRNARLELKLHPLNLSEVVQEVLESLKHMEGLRAVEVHMEVDPALQVTSDKERIKVILSNLVANAVNYRDHAKQSTIHLRATVNRSVWAMQIEDNGIGIRPEHHERIFDMFYKAHDRSQGTGLGLYIVRETLHRLNGEIEVQSEYGKGSLFGFQIPVGDQRS